MLNPLTSDVQFFFRTVVGPSPAFSVRPNTQLQWSVTGTHSTGTWQLEESVNDNFWSVVASGSAASAGSFRVPAGNQPVQYRINILTLPATHINTCVIAASNINMSPEVQAVWRETRRTRHHQIRELIVQAEHDNPIDAIPWCAAPPWTVSTPYVTGSMVRNGAENNVYVCTSGGTSAASGGPLADTFAGIVDNTCTWIYIGRTRAQTAVPLYSTVVPAAAADRMNGFTTVIPSTSLGALNLTNQYDSSDTIRPIRYFGGPLAFEGGRAAILGPNAGHPNAARVPDNARGGFHFQTDARRHVFLWPTAHTRNVFHIEVNGRPLTDGNYSHTSSVSGGGTLLDMSRYGTEVKDIRVYTPGILSSVMHRINIEPTESLWMPHAKSDVVLCIEGDLLTNGVGFGIGSILQPNYIEQLIAKQLGIDNYYINAIIETGTFANNSNARTRFIERLDAIVAMNPDIFMIAGALRDRASDSPDRVAVRASILNYFRTVRAALPNCTVVVCGMTGIGGFPIDPASNFFAHELDIQTSFNTWGDANSIFVPILTRTAPDVPLIRNTNDGWYFLRGGAHPFDAWSPIPRFYPLYANAIVQAIRRFFRAPAPV